MVSHLPLLWHGLDRNALTRRRPALGCSRWRRCSVLVWCKCGWGKNNLTDCSAACMYPQKNRYGWLLLSAVILARFWRLVASLKALVLPLLLQMDGGTIGGRNGYRNGQRSWLTCYRHKTRNILLSAAILARFCRLAVSLKALVLPLLLHMNSGTIGGRYGYQNGQRSWLDCCISTYTVVGIVITIFPADGFWPNQARRALPIVFGRRPCSRNGNRFVTGRAILW